MSRRIEALANEAATAGDLDQVGLCRRALDGDREALELCRRVLRAAEAQAPDDVAIPCTIHEMGNGLPVAGDYVPGGDGELYLVISTGRIETGRSPGAGDWCTAKVEMADWSDCDEGDEFPAQARIGGWS